MIKKILFVVVIFTSTLINAQENTASPYSFYGIGINKFKGTSDMLNMGGLTVYSDSTHVNLFNPASYGGQLLTGFAIGGNYKQYNFKSNTDNEAAKKSAIDYINLAVPITNKVGIVLGLMPQTAVGYRFNNDKRSTTGDFKQYTGEGGLNNVFLGGGYKINNQFSAGVQFQYLFGLINTSTLFSKSGILLSSKETDESSLGGFSINFGFNFNTKIKNKYNFKSVLTYSPNSKLSTTNTRRLATVNVGNDGIVSESGGIDVVVPNNTLTLPSKLTVGAGLGNKQWFVGADITLTGASNQLNRFATLNNTNYKSGTKFVLGGFFLPKVDSYNSYLNRITYRAGFSYENTGLYVNNTAIRDVAVNFGLGLPMPVNPFSQINVGFQLGRLGTTRNNLIQENYFSINIGLLFNDKWFRRPLYN